MCGISGYFGRKNDARKVLLDVLEKLEYRGYDSSGIAFLTDGKVVYKRAVGELENLKKEFKNDSYSKAHIGIAHTRWATHGAPNKKNAHPHKAGSIYLVHNGIIENYKEIKEELEKEGLVFKSDTDSEVVAALVNNYYNQGESLAEAFKKALKRLRGAFAIVLFSEKEPDSLFAARLSSPLALGLGEEEFFLASDALAFSKYTKRVIYLNDYEILSISSLGYKIENYKNGKRTKSKIESLDVNSDTISKSGFKSYMQKEIYEQSDSIESSLRGRVDKNEWKTVLGGLQDFEAELKETKRIHFVACGTSYNAALGVSELFESLANIQVKILSASEARYKKKLFLEKNDIAIFISQSGETADTLAALERYKKEGALCLGVVNTVASSIARKTHAGVYNHAGPEISVASTKAFTSQITILILIAAKLAELKGINDTKRKLLLKSLVKIPHIFKQEAKRIDKETKRIAKNIFKKEHMYFLARGRLLALAEEGALKVKEISYIHAESYPSGELKHGPIALLEKDFPVVFLVPEGELYEKTISNMEETKARGAKVIAITKHSMKEIKRLAHHMLEMPNKYNELDLLVYSLPLQFLAMHLAELRGLNVDKPRNLAKSVTVE